MVSVYETVGVLWVWEQKTDWLIGDYTDLLEKIEKVEKQDRVYIPYNQKKFPRSSDACTLFWPLTAIDSYRNKRRSDEELEDMREYAKKYWNPKYVAWLGNYTNNGANTVVSWHNKNYPNERFAYFRMPALSRYVALAWNKNLWVSLTYKANAKYNVDANDGVLDGVEFGDPTYWHTHAFFYEETIHWVNNYHQYREPNEYDIPAQNLSKLIENKVFYPTAYIYIPEKVIKETYWLTLEEIAIIEKSKRFANEIYKLTHGNEKLYEIEKRATEIAQKSRYLLAKNKIK